MTGLDERPLRPLNCEQVLDRVESDGAFVVFRDTLAPAERAVWQLALRRGAGARGMALAIRDMGGIVLISDSAHVEQVGQIERTLLEVAGDQTPGAATAEDRTRDHPSRGPHLRLVPDIP